MQLIATMVQAEVKCRVPLKVIVVFAACTVASASARQLQQMTYEINPWIAGGM